MKFNTKLLHGTQDQYDYGSTLPPIAQVSAFSVDSPEKQEKIFRHIAPGYAYSRIGNPTVTAFENRICQIEGGITATATSSGMAAVTLAILNIAKSGDEIIAQRELYGGSLYLLKDIEDFGIKVHYVESFDEDFEHLLNKKTRLLFGEFISNPGLKVMDIERASSIAHKHGIPLIVDATTVTPFVAKPLELGADIVVHSSSKYINGSGDAISGVIIDGGHFDYDFDKFTTLKSYAKYKKRAYSIRLKTDLFECIGSCLSPMNAYMNIIGLETLGLRMERILDNAYRLAYALDKLGLDVNYPTLRQKDKVDKYLNGYGGAIVTLRAGSKEKAFKIINNLRFATIASNIGDLRTLVLHPSTTIFINGSEEEKKKAGIYEDTIRISVGIENIEDLIEDFRQAIGGVENEVNS